MRRARELGDPDMPMVHLVEPSYGEYRRTSAQNGLTIKIWRDHVLGWNQEVLPEGGHGLFWTGHPNNPTARAWDSGRLLGFIDRSPELLVVVDEAYLQFLPDEAERSLVRAAADRANLIVLRSMTKIFAFPGLRIGYAVASPEMINRLRRNQQPWTISTAAELAALAAVNDDEYLGAHPRSDHRRVDPPDRPALGRSRPPTGMAQPPSTRHRASSPQLRPGQPG